MVKPRHQSVPCGTDVPRQLITLHVPWCGGASIRCSLTTKDKDNDFCVCVWPAETRQNEENPLGSVELGVKSKACLRALLWRGPCYPPMDWRRERMTWLVRRLHFWQKNNDILWMALASVSINNYFSYEYYFLAVPPWGVLLKYGFFVLSNHNVLHCNSLPCNSLH